MKAYIFSHSPQVHRLPDFTPGLLQIVINETVPLPTRQAGKTGIKTNPNGDVANLPSDDVICVVAPS